MRNVSRSLLLAGLVVVGGLSPRLAALAEDGSAIFQSAEITGEKIGALTGEISTMEKGILVIESGLPPAEKPKIPSPEILRASEELSWVKQMARQAAQELNAAKSAPNAAAAQVMIRDAQIKAETANLYLQRISANLQPAASNQASLPESGRRPTIHLAPEGEALKQLKEADTLAKKGFGTGAVYDGSNPEIDYDPLKQQLRTRDGRVVDVKPLSKIFHGTAPLFRQVSVPGNPRAITQLTPEAKVALASPEARKVGGVDLQVTLDLLGFIGVADFRHQGPAAKIDSPVLISLTGLCERAKPYTADWERLPEELRYPGAIERIHGFVLDPKQKDVFLVGSAARRPEHRMDIDSIIVAVQTVWHKGLTPLVSLDPLPDRPGGPQYSRVRNVPQSSIFARIMLDADYAMKRITFGELAVVEPGYESLAVLIEKDIRAGIKPKDFGCRMWLYPVPIGSGNIHVSSTGRTVLFETRVMALTESGRITSDGFVGTEGADEKPERVAKAFTAVYEKLEDSQKIEPRGVYVLLHGLVDLVTTCKLLREAGIEYPILREASGLPVRRLRGKEAVRAFYHGINLSIFHFDISGGVLARPRLANRMLDRYQDVTTSRLEYAVERFPGKESFRQVLPMTFTLPQSGFERQWKIERLISAGEQALYKGRFEAARGKFLEATGVDPLFSDAWAFLAQAESYLNLHREAAASIGKAVRLEPEDTTFRMIALDIMLRGNPDLDLSPYDEGIRRQLSNEYSERARAAISRKQVDAARRHADTAIKLWDDNTDGYFIRALTWKAGDRRAAGDWIEAIRGYQREMQGASTKESGRRLAHALAARAGVRLAAIDVGRSTREEILGELQRAGEEARRSRALDDSSPAGLVTEVSVRTIRASFYKETGLEPDLKSLRQLADQAVRQFPDFGPAHDWRGMALSLSGEREEAIREFTEAVRLDPTSMVALSGRATLYADRKMCGEATSDFERFRSLGYEVDADLAKAMRACEHASGKKP